MKTSHGRPGTSKKQTRLGLIALATLVAAAACGDAGFDPAPDGTLAIGTWGADEAGMIVAESGVHVHIGCTFGDIEGRVSVVDGRFSIDGSYMLRAFPIAVGPTVPAQFSGQVVGRTLTLAVAVDDTVENQVVSLGPVTVTFEREPTMVNCPICQFPSAVPEREKRETGDGLPR